MFKNFRHFSGNKDGTIILRFISPFSYSSTQYDRFISFCTKIDIIILGRYDDSFRKLHCRLRNIFKTRSRFSTNLRDYLSVFRCMNGTTKDRYNNYYCFVFKGRRSYSRFTRWTRSGLILFIVHVAYNSRYRTFRFTSNHIQGRARRYRFQYSSMVDRFFGTSANNCQSGCLFTFWFRLTRSQLRRPQFSNWGSGIYSYNNFYIVIYNESAQGFLFRSLWFPNAKVKCSSIQVYCRTSFYRTANS